MKKSRIGTTVIVTPAAIERKSDEKNPWSAASPTGSVIWVRSWSISDGHRKSFHDVTNVKIATAAIDGRTIGTRICHQIRHSPAPSTRAASIRSFGTPRNAWRMRKMLNALARAGKITEGSES
jgi:hypothetical protein